MAGEGVDELQAVNCRRKTPLKILIGYVAVRSRSDSVDGLVRGYLERCAAYAPVEVTDFRSERAFFDQVEKLRARTAPLMVLLDSRGKMLSSEGLAGWLGGRRDAGLQQVVFGLGPADGWSPEARQGAGMLLSLGPMTLPHELARLVLAEQIYRAYTILAGHPYHTGH
jgi:23S rRNA (pseudouridine1915-N3)-methyltransferase